MLCFEVLLNGKELCLAGVGESGALSTIVSWVGVHRNHPASAVEHVPVKHICTSVVSLIASLMFTCIRCGYRGIFSQVTRCQFG
jgi:hypothetical protein